MRDRKRGTLTAYKCVLKRNNDLVAAASNELLVRNIYQRDAGNLKWVT
jgi:hypothetical protein